MLRSTVLALLALSLAACGGAGGGGDAASDIGSIGGATLKVYVTDAPFPASHVLSATVVIEEVRARNVDNDTWVTLLDPETDESQEIDLVPLTGGVRDLLLDLPVPVGTYDEVRLVVAAGTVTLNETATVEGDDYVFSSENGRLHVPSGAQTGIKVKIDEPIVVTSTLSEELTLDFDLSRNFVFNGPFDHPPGVKRVLFTPVVRAVNSTTGGGLTFVVLSDGGTDDTGDDTVPEGVEIEIRDADGTVVSTPTPAPDGTVVVTLEAGLYTVDVGATGHVTTMLEEVEVFLGNRTDEGTILLAYAPAELSGTVLTDAGTTETTDDVALEGATVSLVPADDPDATPLEATTDADGAWLLDGLTPGVAWRLTITAEAHADYEMEEDVVLGADEVLALDDVTLTQTTTP